jgi:acyl-CoA synthetase (NDP forming)
MMATEGFYERLKERRDLPPVYRFPEPAARALWQLARYAEWRRRPVEPPREFGFDLARLRALAARTDRDGQLPPEAAFALLEAIGVPVVPWRRAADRAAALAAARELGFPVVAKAVAPGLVHKSELAAVALDLGDEDELARALDDLARRAAAAGLELDGFLIQAMARGGHETLLGVATDPKWGPLVAFGLGGKYVEALGDVAFAAPPRSAAEARELIAGVHGARILGGVRGEAAVDRELLADVLCRLAALAHALPELVELDVNPFVAKPAGEGSCALDVRARVARPTP